jgi:hypothetical protein
VRLLKKTTLAFEKGAGGCTQRSVTAFDGTRSETRARQGRWDLHRTIPIVFDGLDLNFSSSHSDEMSAAQEGAEDICCATV